jgi:hypothetical protein
MVGCILGYSDFVNDNQNKIPIGGTWPLDAILGSAGAESVTALHYICYVLVFQAKPILLRTSLH